MRNFYFEVVIENEDVTRDEAEAFARHHFEQQDEVVFDRFEETAEQFHRTIRVAGRALRRTS